MLIDLVKTAEGDRAATDTLSSRPRRRAIIGGGLFGC